MLVAIGPHHRAPASARPVSTGVACSKARLTTINLHKAVTCSAASACTASLLAPMFSGKPTATTHASNSDGPCRLPCLQANWLACKPKCRSAPFLTLFRPVNCACHTGHMHCHCTIRACWPLQIQPLRRSSLRAHWHGSSVPRQAAAMRSRALPQPLALFHLGTSARLAQMHNHVQAHSSAALAALAFSSLGFHTGAALALVGDHAAVEAWALASRLLLCAATQLALHTVDVSLRSMNARCQIQWQRSAPW